MKPINKKTKFTPRDIKALEENLSYLKLSWIIENYEDLIQQANSKKWSQYNLLLELTRGEVLLKQDKALDRRIKRAKFPIVKTLDQFQWSWPSKINQLLIQNLFKLQFVKNCSNVIFLGNVGLGKTHLTVALAHAACLEGYSVLFSTAIDAINSLSQAQDCGQFKKELSKYVKPQLLVLDELGYLPVDKKGADYLFQIISHRYEQGSTIITSNLAYNKWPTIFNNDSTLTSAILDRLLHHADTVSITGKSYRMKDN